jgi:hypothetical protein
VTTPVRVQCGAEYDLTQWAGLFEAAGKSILIENCHWGNTGQWVAAPAMGTHEPACHRGA